MEKLLAIVGLTQKAYGRWLFQRLIVGAIVVAGMTVLIGILGSALIVAIFYLLYLALMVQGFTAINAMAIVCLTAVVMLGGMVLFTVQYFKSLKKTELSAAENAPIIHKIFEVATSFMDGINHGSSFRANVRAKARRV